MYEFERGNPDNLKGTVWFYANFRNLDDLDLTEFEEDYPSLEDDSIFTLFGSNNVDKFCAETDISRDAVLELYEDPDPDGTMFYKNESVFPPGGLDDLVDGECDIVFVGNYSNPDRCVLAIHAGAAMYFVSCTEQSKSKVRIPTNIVIPLIGSESSEHKQSEPTHYDFRGKSIKDYITREYVIPMLSCIEIEDSKLTETFASVFREFSKDSRFESEVSKFISLAKKGLDIDLLNVYIVKIDAIHLENYEGAGEAQRKIEGMIRNLSS